MSCMVFYSVFLTRPSHICTYFIDDLVVAKYKDFRKDLEIPSLFYHSSND